MVTIRTAKKRIGQLIAELCAQGYNPSRAILFGSVAKGIAHEHSDIDVALWDKQFTGCTPIDYERIVKILRNHPRLEVHTFQEGETKEDNPFIGEIEKYGIAIEINPA